MMRTNLSQLHLEPLEERRVPAAVVAELEPNDQASQANVFAFPSDGQVRLTGASTSKRDRDFFTFTPTASGTVGLTVLNGGNGFVSAEVKLGRTGDVFETDPAGGVNSGSFTVQAGRAYTIKLRAPGNTSISYQVNLTFTPGGAPTNPSNNFNESEPNNGRNQADLFHLGSDGLIHLFGTSTNPRDRDLFTFTPTTSGTLNVQVSSTNGFFAQLRLIDNAGNNLFHTEPENGIDSGSVAVTAGQTYFVRLLATGLDAAAYQVDLTLA